MAVISEIVQFIVKALEKNPELTQKEAEAVASRNFGKASAKEITDSASAALTQKVAVGEGKLKQAVSKSQLRDLATSYTRKLGFSESKNPQITTGAFEKLLADRPEVAKSLSSYRGNIKKQQQILEEAGVDKKVLAPYLVQPTRLSRQGKLETPPSPEIPKTPQAEEVAEPTIPAMIVKKAPRKEETQVTPPWAEEFPEGYGQAVREGSKYDGQEVRAEGLEALAYNPIEGIVGRGAGEPLPPPKSTTPPPSQEKPFISGRDFPERRFTMGEVPPERALVPISVSKPKTTIKEAITRPQEEPSLTSAQKAGIGAATLGGLTAVGGVATYYNPLNTPLTPSTTPKERPPVAPMALEKREEPAAAEPVAVEPIAAEPTAVEPAPEEVSPAEEVAFEEPAPTPAPTPTPTEAAPSQPQAAITASPEELNQPAPTVSGQPAAPITIREVLQIKSELPQDINSLSAKLKQIQRQVPKAGQTVDRTQVKEFTEQLAKVDDALSTVYQDQNAPQLADIKQQRRDALQAYKEKANLNQWLEIADRAISAIGQFASAQAAMGTPFVGTYRPTPVDYESKIAQAFREYQAEAGMLQQEFEESKQARAGFFKEKEATLEGKRRSVKDALDAAEAAARAEAGDIEQANAMARSLFNLHLDTLKTAERNTIDQIEAQNAAARIELKRNQQAIDADFKDRKLKLEEEKQAAKSELEKAKLDAQLKRLEDTRNKAIKSEEDKQKKSLLKSEIDWTRQTIANLEKQNQESQRVLSATNSFNPDNIDASTARLANALSTVPESIKAGEVKIGGEPVEIAPKGKILGIFNQSDSSFLTNNVVPVLQSRASNTIDSNKERIAKLKQDLLRLQSGEFPQETQTRQVPTSSGNVTKADVEAAMKGNPNWTYDQAKKYYESQGYKVIE